MKAYRPLSANEIQTLQTQGCKCNNWNLIKVSENFTPDNIRGVSFSGNIRLGIFNKEFKLKEGVIKKAGIYNATIHHCEIADNVYINHITNHIANYKIAEGAFIDNANTLVTNEESTFGNGTKVSVLDETGSREVAIFTGLSSHLAYILALYKHRPNTIQEINKQITAYAESKRSSIGYIGKHTRIVNCGTIKNIFIGDYASIEGALSLQNGSVDSNENAPSEIGCGVIANHFILASGATLADSATVERCFIGQGSILSKQFSATDSLFFSNCQGFHGEAVSVFAGPYTVTHHKATLLIGGLFSFFNAGSGANQSNHMYKLGPIHHGIVDRGSKMASDSYTPWPSRIGTFSLIMGKHKNKMDSSCYPFSYLIADNEETLIIPAINLRSIGVYRDAKKWQTRDIRKDNTKLDSINFKLLNPYTIQQILNGEQKLKEIATTKEDYVYISKKIKIKNTSIKRGLELYRLAQDIYVGDILVKRLQKQLPLDTETVSCKSWMDLSGLILPQSEIRDMLDKVDNGNLNSLDQIQQQFNLLEKKLNALEWAYVVDILQQKLNKKDKALSKEDCILVLKNWITANRKLEELLIEDAKKEYALELQTSFGIDQREQDKQLEFATIRKTSEQNPFLIQLKKETEEKNALANKLIAELK